MENQLLGSGGESATFRTNSSTSVLDPQAVQRNEVAKSVPRAFKSLWLSRDDAEKCEQEGSFLPFKNPFFH